MTTLNYAALDAEARRTEHGTGLPFVAKNGKKIKLRTIETLPGADLSAALALLDLVQSKKVSNERRIGAISGLLVAVASHKKAMRETVDSLPLPEQMKILEGWMEHAAPGEAAA
ncbi:hypothetical protein [Kitasatospora sp. NPDC088134]|uniref:hypothetical protein n=1 Tax=Kitasatospora sp. NPDC088134 TaxID=3364071 RepID=UPI003820970A